MEPEPDSIELVEESLDIASSALSERAQAFLADGRRRIPQVNCFDFVPSKYEHAWNVLSALPRGTICEWGSGLGIVVGLAEILGYEASGIELDAELAETSRELLKAHGLKAQIYTGSYFEIHVPADYYYVYSWPSQFEQVQKQFYMSAASSSKLLICYGHDDIRIRVKPVANGD